MRAVACRVPLPAKLAWKWLQLASLGQRVREGPLVLIDNLKGALWKIFLIYYVLYVFLM